MNNLKTKALSPVADSSIFKLWLQVIENWQPTTKVESTSTSRKVNVIFTNPTKDDIKRIVGEENKVEETDYTEENNDSS